MTCHLPTRDRHSALFQLKLADTSAIDPAFGLKRGSLQAWREGLKNASRPEADNSHRTRAVHYAGRSI